MRAEADRQPAPQRAVTMEITASRKAPQDQSARIVYDKDSKAATKGKSPPPAAKKKPVAEGPAGK